MCWRRGGAPDRNFINIEKELTTYWRRREAPERILRSRSSKPSPNLINIKMWEAGKLKPFNKLDCFDLFNVLIA